MADALKERFDRVLLGALHMGGSDSGIGFRTELWAMVSELREERNAESARLAAEKSAHEQTKQVLQGLVSALGKMRKLEGRVSPHVAARQAYARTYLALQGRPLPAKVDK